MGQERDEAAGLKTFSQFTLWIQVVEVEVEVVEVAVVGL